MLLDQTVWNNNLYLKLIGEELIKRGEADEEFKKLLEEAECDLKDVFAYISEEARKMPTINQCVALDDATVYGMADKFIREGIWKERKETKAQEEAARNKVTEDNAKRKEEREQLRTAARKGAGVVGTAAKTKVEEKTVKKEVKEKPKKETLEDVFGGLFD